MADVELVGPFQHTDVIVRGRRVPFLTASTAPGGKVILVFDRRLALELDAGNYEHAVAFVADVIENCFHPQIGRTFNRVHEVTAVGGEEDDQGV